MKSDGTCRQYAILLALGLSVFPFASVAAQQSYNAGSMLVHTFELSSDALEGRRVGSAGNAVARQMIVDWLRAVGLDSLNGSFVHPFDFSRGGTDGQGANILGSVVGSSYPERIIVVSAHYDHLGIRNGEIYNGADDDASGTAAVMALAEYFSRVYRPHHTIVFALFDGEEAGLLGSNAFVRQYPVILEEVVLDVNLDMVSRNNQNELFASGTYHNPFLTETLKTAADRSRPRLDGPFSLRFGHDLPGTGHDDWTNSSDHGPFHRAGIPFVYFGVEDHADYHKPTDDFANISPRFFVNAVEVILQSIVEMDAHLEQVNPE